MKKTGMLIAVCIIMSAANCLAQGENIPWLHKQAMKKNALHLKTGVEGSYPRHVDEYNWGTDWSLYQTRDITYNTGGDPVIIEFNQGGARHRNLLAYNDQHLLTEDVSQIYSGTTWNNTTRSVTTYNNLGYEIEYRSEQWNGTAWVLSTGQQITYEMDGDRLRVATFKNWTPATSTWVNSTRETYTYSGTDQRYSSFIAEQWNNAWVYLSKMDVSWNGNNVAQFISYAYEGGAWVPTGKITYDWGENNSSVMVMYTYLGTDTWLQSMRTTTNFDSHGNQTLSQVEMYFGNAWMMISATRYQLTYAGNNLTMRITQSFDTVQWANILKEVFSNFASLGTDVNLIPDVGLTVFPNPAGQQALVRISLPESGDFTLSILSMTGQKISEESLSGQGSDINYQLNLEKVPPGSYLIIARDKQGKELGKTRLIRQ